MMNKDIELKMHHKISTNYLIKVKEKKKFFKYNNQFTIGNSILGKGLGVGKIKGFLSSASKCIIEPFSK